MHGKLGAAQDMEVQVEDGLAGICAAIGDDAVSVCDACLLCNRRDLLEDFCNGGAVIRCDFVHGGDVCLGNHQHMNGGFGVDVTEGQHGVVLVHLGGRDLSGNNFTENAVHKGSPDHRFC